MDLILWQRENRWSNFKMAIQLGITHQTLSKVRRKKQRPSLLLAKAIENFTRGVVTVKDLRD